MGSPKPDGYCAIHDDVTCGCPTNRRMDVSIAETLDRWAPVLSRLAAIGHLNNLASNLRQAAGLCAAFSDGYRAAAYYATGQYKEPAPWWPNIEGKPAPGGSGEG